MDYHIWNVTLDPENSAQNIEQAAKKYWCGTVKLIKHRAGQGKKYWAGKERNGENIGLGKQRNGGMGAKKYIKHEPRQPKKYKAGRQRNG